MTGVFGADAGQDALYDRSGMPEMAALAVNGHAATVLTYGQTGSGKTYTVYGEETTVATAGWQGGPKDGLLPRTLEDLFARLAPERPPRDGPRRQGPEDSLPPEVAVHVTAVEIYNDQVRCKPRPAPATPRPGPADALAARYSTSLGATPRCARRGTTTWATTWPAPAGCPAGERRRPWRP